MYERKFDERFSAEKAEALANDPESLEAYIAAFKDWELPQSPYCMERYARIETEVFESCPNLYKAARAL